MKVVKIPPRRARITQAARDDDWRPICTTGDARHWTETMEIDLGRDHEGRMLRLRLKPKEASTLIHAIQLALSRRATVFGDDTRTQGAQPP